MLGLFDFGIPNSFSWKSLKKDRCPNIYDVPFQTKQNTTSVQRLVNYTSLTESSSSCYTPKKYYNLPSENPSNHASRNTLTDTIQLSYSEKIPHHSSQPHSPDM